MTDSPEQRKLASLDSEIEKVTGRHESSANELKSLLEERNRVAATLGMAPREQPKNSGGAPPKGPAADFKAKADEEDTLATLYDRMGPGEVTKLYIEDKPAWERMMQAVEQRGLRKLFNGGTR